MSAPLDGTVLVLVVQAHPDDADISSGASIARWCLDGARVVYVSCTSGEAGESDPPVTPAELGRLREEESVDAARVLGVTDVRFLRYPDGGLTDTPELRAELAELMLELRPTRVATHDPTAKGEGHPDHLAAGRAVTAGVVAASEGGVRVPEVWLFRSDAPNRAVDVSETLDRKLEAVEQHRTQRSMGEAPPEAIRAWAARNGEQWNLAAAETFRALSSDECDEMVGAL